MIFDEIHTMRSTDFKFGNNRELVLDHSEFRNLNQYKEK